MANVKTISTEQLQQRLKQGNSLHFWNVSQALLGRQILGCTQGL